MNKWYILYVTKMQLTLMPMRRKLNDYEFFTMDFVVELLFYARVNYMPPHA